MKVVTIGDATLYCGDCREVLPTLTKIDAVVTDSPYLINSKSDGRSKLSPWADICNNSVFIADWVNKCMSKMESGPLWTFLNWRTLASWQKAACDLRIPIESLLIWDKECTGPGGLKGLRPSFEMVALFCLGSFGIKNRSLSDVQRFFWPTVKATGHPAEKPEALMRWLIEISTLPQQVILDPFMGSGTTGAAAVKLGRRFIGIELDEKWFDFSCRRIEQAQHDTSLLGLARPAQEQMGLGV